MGRASELRTKILEALPEGTVVPRHTEKAHFYEVPRVGATYPSVTGKLQALKDEGLINYKMNRALEYVSSHREEMVDPERAMQVLDEASKESDVVLRDAGEIGTIIHDAREAYFAEWIKTGERPQGDLKRFIRTGVTDRRAISGLRGVERFAIECKYQPIASELYVYDEEWETAGSLDDVGLIGDAETFVLLDLKSSNRFKAHYFFQVSMYWRMFGKLTGIWPERALILKSSKEDGTYKLEELRDLPRLVEYAGHLIKVNEGLSFIEAMRKDNQKNVISV
jgi:hypothetical protein